MSKKTMLWVGDAACPSGFARETHEVLNVAKETHDIYVLGINYRGDPHNYPYRIWAAAPGGDYLGIGRLIWMCDLIMQETGAAPDVIVLLNDGWNLQAYINQLRLKKSNGEYAWPDYAEVPVVAIVAVDGENFHAGWLEGVEHAVFWTKFALDEARDAGYAGPASVISLGVDLELFKPMDKNIARRTQGLGQIEDAFIVGNVNRNQPRKRWDLTIRYFAEWVYKGMPLTLRDGQNMKIKDAFLYLHVAPTGDTGVKIRELCQYYGILPKLCLLEPPMWYGAAEKSMAATYNCFDVAITTTQGEGFGLTTLEAMACRVPVIAPKWAALGDWADGAAWLVPCTSTAIGPPYVNVIGGVVDEHLFVSALSRLYHDREALANNAQAAFERAQEPRFRWSVIGAQFMQVVESVTTPQVEEVTV